MAGPHQQLRLLINSLGHESSSVRHAALGELRTFLHAHRAFLTGLLTDLAVAGPAAGGSNAASSSSKAGGGVATSAAGSGGGKADPAESQELLADLMGALLRCCDNAIRTPRGIAMKQRLVQVLSSHLSLVFLADEAFLRSLHAS